MRLAELLGRLIVVVALSWTTCAGAQVAAASSAPAISASAVRAATSAVEADPQLGGREPIKRLRFKKQDEERRSKPDNAGLWWAELVAHVSGGLRVAVWLLGAGLLIAVLLRLRDGLMARERGAVPAISKPSHVGTLDIRPESLPKDVGGAARELWLRGELRAALSLLYRGALSRLVHGHGIAIRSASTENDCLRLAHARLQPDSIDYLRQLIACWQAAAYAQHEVPAEHLERLCVDFDARLPASPARSRAA